MRTLALTALAVMGMALAMPASAAQPNVCFTHSGSVDLDAIRDRMFGPNVVSVEQWGGCARVTYRQMDGRLAQMLVDPQTLQVVPGGVIAR